MVLSGWDNLQWKRVYKMAEKGIFTKFVSAFWKTTKSKYPFVQRMDESFAHGIPKSSSFYLGISPIYKKHVIINFQHSNKPWEIGLFTINLHISTQFEVTSHFNLGRDEYINFQDGLYRLPLAVGDGKWWQLKPLDNEAIFGVHWKPSTYTSEDIVIQEAVKDVCLFLEESLFRKAGFIS